MTTNGDLVGLAVDCMGDLVVTAVDCVGDLVADWIGDMVVTGWSEGLGCSLLGWGSSWRGIDGCEWSVVVMGDC